jgi:hypothetical protein
VLGLLLQGRDAAGGGAVSRPRLCDAWPVDEATYHGERGWWGNSSIETFRRSPRQAWWEHVQANGRELARSTEDTFDFGRLGHCMLLTPNLVEQGYAIRPCDEEGRDEEGKDANDRRLKGWKTWAAQQRPGVTLVRPKDAAKGMRIKHAIASHKDLSGAFEVPFDAEFSVRWVDEETGVQCKVRFDYVRFDDGVVLDLKTVDEKSQLDPRSIGKRIAQLGYHRAVAFYSMGFYAYTGEWPRYFGLAFASKRRPHEVAVYNLTPDQLEAGYRQRRGDLERLAAVLEREKTEGPSAWLGAHETGVHEPEMPFWALQED